jgi:SAM-dependent methyltransferase
MDARPAALAQLRAGVAEYYTAKLRRFGATPLGVDWTCLPTQQMRFVQLLKLCDFATPFSLNDLGCGYGALLDYLDGRHAGAAIEYVGIDVSEAMVRRARRRYRGRTGARFMRGHRPSGVAAYSVASGIFNVQRDQPLPLWEDFVAATLADLHRSSTRGFAVNFVAPGMRRAGLYTAHPQRWAQHCANAFGASVTAIEDYGLPEFTLLVRRSPTR